MPNVTADLAILVFGFIQRAGAHGLAVLGNCLDCASPPWAAQAKCLGW